MPAVVSPASLSRLAGQSNQARASKGGTSHAGHHQVLGEAHHAQGCAGIAANAGTVEGQGHQRLQAWVEAGIERQALAEQVALSMASRARAKPMKPITSPPVARFTSRAARSLYPPIRLLLLKIWGVVAT